jgi:hypothetical protein
MSEGIQKLRRMLSQAQMFAAETPMEAVARIKLVQREATALLSTAKSEEREDVESLLAIAKARREQYERELQSWDARIRERASQFVSNEQARIGYLIPRKV